MYIDLNASRLDFLLKTDNCVTHTIKSQRLFSNLEQKTDASGDTLQHRPGSLLNSISLIAGTTIGAGILALPAATLPAGLVPSSLLMVGVWLYMAVSGLLIAEVNLQAMRLLGQPSLGFMGTVRYRLGKVGAAIAAILYIFNHYALLVAYTARGGDILASALGHLEVNLQLGPAMPLWWGHIIFAGLLGSVLLLGSERSVGRLNSVLLAIVIVSFGGLLALTLGQVHVSQWLSGHWEAVSAAVPVMFVAFVYHNVVPVVTTQLEGDRAKIRRSIFIGSLIPLLMFLVWNAVVLGSVEVDSTAAVDPLEILRTSTINPKLGVLISVFSEFAIATSFIGFVYGLRNFFEDVLRYPVNLKLRRWVIYALVLVPPIAPSILNPNIFFEAMDSAGAFGVSVLFGIIPAVMAWRSRYIDDLEEEDGGRSPLVLGGKTTLALSIGIASAVFVQNALVALGL